MAVIHQHWYSLNTARQFPLADNATGTGQNGKRLPTDIIADLNLRYPNTLGRYPFISAVSVTERLVTIVIQAVDDLDDLTTLAPLAVISIPKPITEGRHYPVKAQVLGVGGWIVLGNGVSQAYSGAFTPRAGVLAPRAARAYRPLPVSSMAVLHNSVPLTGIVRLRGESPVEIVATDREIDGVVRTVALIQLVQPGGPTNTQDTATALNVFEEFAGPCAARPDTGNCPDPQPIEYLNAVQPDCDGNITIEFRGCATIANIVGTSGIMLDCGLGLTDACAQNHLPDPNGKLRTEYSDDCHSLSAGDDPFFPKPSPPVVPDPPLPHESASASVMTTGALPYVERFSHARIPAYWFAPSGYFGFSNDISPTAPVAVPLTPAAYFSFSTAAAGSMLNIAVWNGWDTSSLMRRYQTDVKLLDGGTKHVAGLLFNYRQHEVYSTRHVYFVAVIDYEKQQLILLRHNGVSLVSTGVWADLINLQRDRWYRITAEIVPGTGSNVNITVTLAALDGPALTATLGPLSTSEYLPDTGNPGFYADRSVARFTDLSVAEI